MTEKSKSRGQCGYGPREQLVGNKRSVGSSHEQLVSNKRSVGSSHEQLAAEYLKREGYRILCMNFRSRYGEIDIVAMEGDILVFLEVKYRSGRQAGAPWEAVNIRKQGRICRTADFYRVRYGVGEDVQVRFDVVAILDGKLFLFRNAFFYREASHDGRYFYQKERQR